MLYSDCVFQHGHIITLDPSFPTAQAVAVREGKILAVGSNEDIASLIGARTQVTDLQGCTVVPGFHDAHCHILSFGLSVVEVNARSATTILEVVEGVGAHVR